MRPKLTKRSSREWAAEWESRLGRLTVPERAAWEYVDQRGGDLAPEDMEGLLKAAREAGKVPVKVTIGSGTKDVDVPMRLNSGDIETLTKLSEALAAVGDDDGTLYIDLSSMSLAYRLNGTWVE